MKKIYTMLLFVIWIISFSQSSYPIETVIPENYNYFTGHLVSKVYPGSQKMFMIQDKNGNKLFRNEGSNWKEVLSDFHFYAFQGQSRQLLLVDDNEIWALKSNKIIRSVDYGDTWSEYIDIPEGPEYAISDIFKRGNYLYLKKYGVSAIDNQTINKIYKTEIKTNPSAWISLPLNNTIGYHYNFFLNDNSILRFYGTKKMISNDDGLTWIESELKMPIAYVRHSGDGGTIVSFGENYILVSNDFAESYVTSKGIPKSSKINDVQFYNDFILADIGYKTKNGQLQSTDGLYISYDNGANFVKLIDGLSLYDIVNPLSFSADSSNIFVSFQHGFRKITNDNTSYEDCNNGFNNYIPKNITEIEIDPSGRIYAYSSAHGLFISGNNGISWTKDKNLMDPYRMGAHKISTSSNNIIYSSTYDPSGTAKSIDGGITWSKFPQVTPYTVRNIFADRNNPNRVVIVSSTPDGGGNTVYMGTLFSKDGGVTFGEKFYSEGTYFKPMDNELANDVLFYDDKTILMCFNNRILRTLNNGTTWESIPLNFTFNKMINLENEIYAINNSEMYRSTNLGTSWSLITLPIEITNIKEFSFFKNNNTDSSKGIAISSNSGVYILINNIWTKITTESFDYIAFNEVTNQLFMGNNNSLKKIETSQLSTLNFIKGNSIKLYPNPTKDIVFLESKEIINSLELYDLQGKLLKQQNCNSKKVQVSIQDLPNAVYLIKAKTNNGIETFKVIKN